MIKWAAVEGRVLMTLVRPNVESGARIRERIAALGIKRAGLIMSPGETIIRKKANTAKRVLIVQTRVHGPVLSNFFGFKRNRSREKLKSKIKQLEDRIQKEKSENFIENFSMKNTSISSGKLESLGLHL